MINYQGKLTDAQGNELSGTKNLEFNLYDAPTGGNLVWGPQIFDNVPVVNGYFNVILGSKDSNDRSITDAFGSAKRFISIKIIAPDKASTDTQEILPRQQILSSPYAIQAERAEDSGIPVGSIMAFFGHKAPEGWLMCDGSVIPDQTEFTAIRELVGNNTPDLRGMFLRGMNNGRTDGKQDPDGESRTLGGFQSDTFRKHSHNLFINANAGNTWSIEHAGDYGGSSGSHLRITDYVGGSETRPKNVAVNYIIKY